MPFIIENLESNIVDINVTDLDLDGDNDFLVAALSNNDESVYWYDNKVISH